jgi:monovalent cation/hydrogen antiporter
VGLRLLWFFTVTYVNPLLDRLLKTQYLRFPWQERLVMGWSGMRGAISLAVALALPLETTTGAFPERDLILFLTVCVIFVTLVLQGITLPILIVRLGVVDEGHDTRMEELEARLEASQAVLEKIEDLGKDEQISPRTRERLRDLYQERVERYEAGLEAGRVTEEYEEGSAAWSRWRRELFEAERAAILSLRDEGKISAEVMRRIERDIDLEELRFSG